MNFSMSSMSFHQPDRGQGSPGVGLFLIGVLPSLEPRCYSSEFHRSVKEKEKGLTRREWTKDYFYSTSKDISKHMRHPCCSP